MMIRYFFQNLILSIPDSNLIVLLWSFVLLLQLVLWLLGCIAQGGVFGAPNPKL